MNRRSSRKVCAAGSYHPYELLDAIDKEDFIQEFYSPCLEKQEKLDRQYALAQRKNHEPKGLRENHPSHTHIHTPNLSRCPEDRAENGIRLDRERGQRDFASKLDQSVLEEIVNTVRVNKPGERYGQISRLVYAIRKRFGKDVDKACLRRIYYTWHERYQKVIRTSAAESCREFLDCFDNICLFSLMAAGTDSSLLYGQPV